MSEALLAEGFKSCKTLKQENTPQVTSEGILNKAWRKFNRKISEGYAIN
jgi:hypothetical protein